MSLAQGSPRLPSPPPATEIQLGPKSPGLSAAANRQAQQTEQTINDANAKRRIHPGTKAEDMAAGPPLVPLNELDSAFQLQEHLAALHHHHSASQTTAITPTTAAQLTRPPPGIDQTLWLYELCRFLITQCNGLIVGFLFDNPPCSSATCPEMRASEWQFLCAVHDQPKSCCAIDYCCHTLDWAANIVTNPKIFPSRFIVASDGHDKASMQKNLVNVFRRLHRIFAHAWFQHRDVFRSVESQTGLYVFFKTVCDIYDLLPAENYKLPPEAEGLESESPNKDERRHTVTSIAKPPNQQGDGLELDDRNSLHARRSSTARHLSRPSTGSAVTTVIEEGEDEHSDVTGKLRNMHISGPDDREESSEVEVPVIVEGSIMDGSMPADPPSSESFGQQGSGGDQENIQTDSEPLPDAPFFNQVSYQTSSESSAKEADPAPNDGGPESLSEGIDPAQIEITSPATTTEASEEIAKSDPSDSEEESTVEKPSTG